MHSTKRQGKHVYPQANTISQSLRRLLDSICDHRADYQEFQKTRQTMEHMTKLGRCKTLWLISGLVMLLHPAPGFVLAVALFAIFLSFAILDK